MSKPKDLGLAVVESIQTDSTIDLVKEYCEIGIDAALSDGALKDLPIVSTIVAFGKLGVSINNRLLIIKLMKFLSQSQSMTAQERIEMVQKLESDPAYGRKVGEHLIELLDRIESQLKPEMLSLVFKAYAASEIDADMLHRLNNAIERIPHFEIPNIRVFNDMTPDDRLRFNASSLQAFVNAGLATLISGYGKLVYKPNEVCEKFLSIGLDKVTT